jgi:hypothetical protein
MSVKCNLFFKISKGLYDIGSAINRLGTTWRYLRTELQTCERGVSCDPQTENRLPGLTRRARLSTATNQLVPASECSMWNSGITHSMKLFYEMNEMSNISGQIFAGGNHKRN